MSAVGLLMLLLLGLASCQGTAEEPEATSTPPTRPGATSTVSSPTDSNASVTGTVTYRERLALTGEASLVVELRDVSYADAAAPLIASQTIHNPGQVPITFEVPYNRADIDRRKVYSITARIIESDGRLAFTNDTAYEVITRGNPGRVDMLLVLVQPPPQLLEESESGSDWRTWVEVPAPVVSANLLPNEAETFLRIVYLQSTIEGCARPGNISGTIDGDNINVRLTLMQPPETPWAIPCDEEVVELDEVLPVPAPLQPGTTYRVVVNGIETTIFSLPDPALGHTYLAESPVQRAEIEEILGEPGSYQLRVISGRPSGSCTQYNGYEIQWAPPDAIHVTITHHQVADPNVGCTKDFPVDETLVPLDLGLEPGSEYTIDVNGEIALSLTAR